MFHLTRAYKFSAIHKLEPVEQIHGHEYTLEVTLASATLKPQSFWITDRDKMDEIVHTTIIRKLHGSSLNLHLKIASGENLVCYIFNRLLQTELKAELVQVAIQETRKNRFECRSSRQK